MCCSCGTAWRMKWFPKLSHFSGEHDLLIKSGPLWSALNFDRVLVALAGPGYNPCQVGIGIPM